MRGYKRENKGLEGKLFEQVDERDRRAVWSLVLCTKGADSESEGVDAKAKRSLLLLLFLAAKTKSDRRRRNQC